MSARWDNMAASTAKIFRDPLYNYISIDRDRDGWLLEILDCLEMQRLRRIHQLGISYFTYPGADHNRLAHSLGVVHLMQQALEHLGRMNKDTADGARHALLACALLHDVGHGPFSHLFEPCLGVKHEYWSKQVILNTESKINRILRRHSFYLPQTVADLIDERNQRHPAWQKALLSSQLDMDRLDYLRRDSLFTGAGYGHFDFYRILNTFELYATSEGSDLIWTEKSKLAIEEYIFARYYMYQNVYFHKTTRCFETILKAMWERAKALRAEGDDVTLVPVLMEFWNAHNPSVDQYLRIEEFTVMQQIQQWQGHRDKALSDLAGRFLNRIRFAAVEPPSGMGDLAPDYSQWEAALQEVVAKAGYQPPQSYCLKDQVDAKYHEPYFPEREGDEQSARNAIRINTASEKPAEIATILPRLKAVTGKAAKSVRYYFPAELRSEVMRLRGQWKME